MVLAVLSFFLFHRGDQITHLRVVEGGQPHLANLLVEICDRCCVRVEGCLANALTALIALPALAETGTYF
jgi:hypothetical protein